MPLTDDPVAETRTAVERARARSYVYGLLAAALRHPDERMLSLLRGVAVECVAPLGDQLRDRVAALRDAAVATTTTDLAERYAARVGHAVRGACPPYELEYGGRAIIQQASELADIAGFYEAYGLSAGGPEPDRPDHFSVECEFMQVLTAKEALAVETGNEDHLRLCRDTQVSFLESHWAQWAPALAHRLIEAEADDYYGRVGRCVAAFVVAECDALGVEVGPEYLELKPADPEADTTITCGAGGACPAAAIFEGTQRAGESSRAAPDAP